MTTRTIQGRQMIWRCHRVEINEDANGKREFSTICGKPVPVNGSVYLSCRGDEATCLKCALMLDQEKIDTLSAWTQYRPDDLTDDELAEYVIQSRGAVIL